MQEYSASQPGALLLYFSEAPPHIPDEDFWIRPSMIISVYHLSSAANICCGKTCHSKLKPTCNRNL